MTTVKDEAYYETLAAEAARELAAIRRPKLEAALTTLDAMAEHLAALTAQRDQLPAGEARNALANVVSILTSAPGIVRYEIANLAPEQDASA